LTPDGKRLIFGGMSTATFDKLPRLEIFNASALHDAVASKANVELVRIEVERVHTAIEKAKGEVLRWVLPFILAQIGLAVGLLVKLH